MMAQQLKKLKVDEALNANVWDVDEEPHIKVDFSKCVECDTKPCVRLCPAGCFTLLDKEVLFSYEGCVECGTCRIVCPKGAVDWNYPLSGRGVQYRFG